MYEAIEPSICKRASNMHKPVVSPRMHMYVYMVPAWVPVRIAAWVHVFAAWAHTATTWGGGVAAWLQLGAAARTLPAVVVYT